MTECGEGGSDLDQVVGEMVRARESLREGVSRCKGWEDQGRMGKHRCLDELRYSVEIYYQDQHGATSLRGLTSSEKYRPSRAARGERVLHWMSCHFSSWGFHRRECFVTVLSGDRD